MWVKFNPHVIILTFANIFTASCQEKGSLTFVIDNTLSMTEAIDQVKDSADSITDIVFNEKASQIKNMVLVTFNDPYAKLVTVTENRDHFKKNIYSIYVQNPFNNWDCPEASMNGILYALENSLPNSFVYVFTDASAKDYMKMKQVQIMCQKKQTQIVFVLTGYCNGPKEKAFQVYYDIAAKCSGFVIFVPRNQVQGVMPTIRETIIGNKTVIETKKTPPYRYTDVPFKIDEQTEYAIITASGVDVVLSVRGPRASQERLTWLDNFKVIKLSDPTAGQYVATVRGRTETSLYIVGRTDFNFRHGFSTITPKSIKDTTPQPIADAKTYLLISVVDPKHTVNILSVQLLDMQERVIKTEPLTFVSKDFYTTPPFVAPSQRFKIVVIGNSARTGREITRTNKIPITPQEPPRPDPKKPVITISEGSVTEVEYGKALTLTCKVSAYPEPTITWKNARGDTLESRSANLEPPYEFISYLTISEATYDDSYTCYAANTLGRSSKTINVSVKGPFVIDPAIGGTKALQYGQAGTLRCNIKASVPMHIYWSYVDKDTSTSKRLATSEKYTISADGSTLTINEVDLDTPGKYMCLASVDKDTNKFVSFDTQVEIVGLVLPNVNGNAENKVLRFTNAIIECFVTGVPKPTITWQFMPKGGSKFVPIPGSDSVLHIPNVDIKHEGRYKCIANNIMGNHEHDTTLILQSKPQFISSSPDVYNSVEGVDKTLRIPCMATGLPKPVITWEVNGEKIHPSSKYSIEEEALVIRDPKVGDSQRYSCKATNDVGSVSATFNVEVHQMPEVSGIKALKTIKGHSVNIECSVVKGVPKPTITWQFMAKDNSRFVSIPVSDNVLRIPHVEEKDAGQYKCVAHNRIGNAEQVTTLTVQVPPQISSSASDVYEAIEDRNDVLTIPCATIGLPKPVITWKLNEVTITPGAKYSIKDGSLVIKDPKVSDSQRYTCEARNEAGFQSATFQATILQAPQVSGPVAVTLKTGEPFEIACTVLKGVPTPTIAWQFMDKDDSKFESIPVSGNVLRIPHVAETDSGRYKCVAHNRISNAEQVTTLTVQVPPQISSSSSDVYEAVEDRDAVLKIPCATTGLPKPVITWKLNEVTIRPGAKYSIEDGTLVIKDPKVSDSQRYTCEARNDAGFKSATFQATILQVPRVSRPMAVTLKTGETFEIACTVHKVVPTPTITWQFMAKHDSKFVSIPVSDNVLRIPHVEETNAGQYKCVAHNRIGNAEQVTTLTVQVPPQISSSSSEVYEAIEDRDDVLTIPCATTGLPKPVITWKLNEVTITPGAKYSIDDGSLVIKDPKVSDSQRYTCEARNEAGFKSATFQATILQAPQVSGPIAVTLKTGEPFEIACTVLKGVPTPAITWQFMAKDDSKFESIPVSDNVLRIPHVEVTDAGQYKCVAHNRIGNAEQVTTLTVQVPPQISSSSSDVYEAIEDRDDVLAIPCAATGLPKPVITWKLNEVTITPGEKYSIKDGSLVIKDPKVSDSQRYTCEAKNDAGFKSATFQATILQAPQVSGPMAVTLKTGETFEIACTVHKVVPTPTITWQFMAKHDSKFVSIPVSDNVLRIPHVEETDAGQYKCVAHNRIGDAEQVTSLTVQVPPQISSSSSEVYEAIEDRDDVLTIPCATTGLPKPVITWKLNEVTIAPGEKYSIADGSLVIKDPKVSDSQRYTCEARNDAGFKSATFQATILQAPQVSGPKAVTLKTGETFEIACSVLKGVPTPTIAWQFMDKDDSKFESIPVSGNVLRIPHVKETDAGRYKCVAHNHIGNAEQVISLTVQVPPQILSDSSDIYKSVEDRDAVMMIPCAAIGLPKPVITWKLNEVTIIPSAKYSFKDGPLIIKDPKVSDSQMYTCEAKNDAGVTSTTFQAEVLQEPKVSGIAEKTVKTGESVEIECTVSKGVPKPRIIWLFMANDASEFVEIKNKRDPPNYNVMRMSNVSREHAGHYKCVAENTVGEDQHISTLIVQFAPIITSDDSTTYVGVEGDVTLRIPCDTLGVPPPVISWKKNGDVITPNAKYSIVAGTLLIIDPNKNDNNNYTCEAKNYLGSVAATFETVVQKFVDDYGNVTEVNVPHGTTKRLECESADPTQSVRWFLDGTDLNLTGKIITFENVALSNRGNYTCRVSDMNGTRTYTYAMEVGYAPTFKIHQDTTFNWSGSEDELIDCEVEATPSPDIVWTYNGKQLSQKTQSLAVDSNWGHYTCNMSNVYGEVHRSFDVTSYQCLIPRKFKDVRTTPLILTEIATWPELITTTNYLQVEPSETIAFSCPSREGVKNSLQKFPAVDEIRASCDKEDVFIVDGEPHEVSDFQCTHEIDFVVVKKPIKCLTESSELIRVGFDVHGFLETYEVCYDVSKNVPIYTRVVMSQSNSGIGITPKWSKYPGIGEGKGDGAYTCEKSTSSCCYSKTQLVNSGDVNDGPAQKSTLIDPLNAVPYWRPCDVKEDPWDGIEDTIRSRFDTYPQFVVWSGTHTLQERNGEIIPRYLWKVLRFDESDSLAIVYVNDPSPANEDFLCKNICENGRVPWVRKNYQQTYCCNVDDFLQAFGLRDSTIGESVAGALEKVLSRTN